MASETKTPAPATKPAKREETKAQAFVRLAKPRMTKALKAIKQVENLSGRTYEFSATQAAQVIGALYQAVQRVEEAYNRPAATGGTEGGFEFKG